jgi:hypothetical protein
MIAKSRNIFRYINRKCKSRRKALRGFDLTGDWNFQIASIFFSRRRKKLETAKIKKQTLTSAFSLKGAKIFTARNRDYSGLSPSLLYLEKTGGFRLARNTG